MEEVRNFVVKADPGFYLLTAWGVGQTPSDDVPFMDALPIVAWNVRLGEECENGDLPATYAAPVVPGWAGNDDRATIPWCIQMPGGKVVDQHGDNHENADEWFKSVIRSANRMHSAEQSANMRSTERHNGD